MKTFLKVFLHILLLSQIFRSIESQSNTIATEETTTQEDITTTDIQTDQQSEETTDSSDSYQSEETTDSSDSHQSEETTDSPDSSNDESPDSPDYENPVNEEPEEESEQSQEDQPDYNEENQYPNQTGSPNDISDENKPLPDATPPQEPESGDDYEWWPVILIVIVFICCAILGICWSIMKCNAIKKAEEAHKGGAHEERQISDTVHKDDKPDEAPVAPGSPSNDLSDTPRSSIVEPMKSQVEPSVKEEKSEKLKPPSDEAAQSTLSSTGSSATSSAADDKVIKLQTPSEMSQTSSAVQSDMGSAISKTPSDETKTVSLKEPSDEPTDSSPKS